MQALIICMTILISHLDVERINFIENRFIPIDYVSHFIWGWNHVHVALDEGLLDHVSVVAALVGGPVDVPAAVHDHLLGQEEVLVQAVLLDCVLFQREEGFADAFGIFDHCVGDLLVLVSRSPWFCLLDSFRHDIGNHPHFEAHLDDGVPSRDLLDAFQSKATMVTQRAFREIPELNRANQLK